jgi:predicted NBD/HSP70 family sugar kinase
MNLSALRDHNSARILGLLRRTEAASRVELAAATGLTPQAVSKITARLLAEGLLAEAGRGAAAGGRSGAAPGGKPRTLLRLRPEAGYAVGIGLDTGELTAVLVDLTGRIVHRRTAGFDPSAGPRAGVAAIAGIAGESAAGIGPGRQRLLGVGIGARGPLDHATGVLHQPTGWPDSWRGFALRDAVSEALGGVPVAVDKDTNAAAVGEPAGSAESAEPLVSLGYLHLGRGLGAGLVLDGALYRGPHTNAGEFGHQTVQLDGPRCACGNRGCLEALALAAPDEAAAARLVGIGAANLVRLLDLDRIVLGGSRVLAAPDRYAAEVTAQLRAYAPTPAGGTPVPPATVSVTAYGSAAVPRGAAELALAPLFARPV